MATAGRSIRATCSLTNRRTSCDCAATHLTGWKSLLPAQHHLGGAAGGGLARIQASTLQLDGSILADGGTASSSDIGGGSGGGIWVNVNSLRGTGLIRAAGGDVEVISEKGAGTTMRILLPLVLEKELAASSGVT